MMDQPLLASIVSELRLTPVLACHSVREGGVSSRYTLSPRRLDEQLIKLRAAGSGFVTFSSAAGALEARARGHRVCLTFDDGYAGFAAKAPPVLRRRRVVRRRACRAWPSGMQNGWTLLRKVLPVGPRQDAGWQVAGR
jgi:hypothetical protein